MTSLDLKFTISGVLLPVHAHAGARKNQISGIHDGRLKVSVTQAPEQGKANQAIQRLIAEAFRIPRAQITLVSGAKSSRKMFCLAGISLKEAQERELELLAPSTSHMIENHPQAIHHDSENHDTAANQ